MQTNSINKGLSQSNITKSNSILAPWHRSCLNGLPWQSPSVVRGAGAGCCSGVRWIRGASLDRFLFLLLLFPGGARAHMSCMLSMTLRNPSACSLALIYGEDECETHLLVSRGKAGGRRLSEKIGNSSGKHCEVVIWKWRSWVLFPISRVLENSGSD